LEAGGARPSALGLALGLGRFTTATGGIIIVDDE
jgi:hypothetical protein